MTAPVGVRGKAKPLYRKRRPWPAMVLFAVLAVVAGFVWVKVINTTDDVDAAVHCNAPGPLPAKATPPATPAPKPGTALAHDALDKTAPAPAAQVRSASSTQRDPQPAAISSPPWSRPASRPPSPPTTRSTRRTT